MILETRSRRFTIDLDVARAQLKRPVNQIDSPARETGRKERTEIQRAVALNTTRDHNFRKRLVNREFQVRVRLVVLKLDVVTRLVLFDERRFEY